MSEWNDPNWSSPELLLIVMALHGRPGGQNSERDRSVRRLSEVLS